MEHLSAIVAVGPNGEIGVDGGLPWPRLKRDMQWFARHTRGKRIVMGRHTWDSLPVKPLPGRDHVVLTRDRKFIAYWAQHNLDRPDEPTVVAFHNWVDLIDWIRNPPRVETMVIGGGRVYTLFLPHVTTIYLTRVEGQFPFCDTHFPYPLAPSEWREETAYDRPFVDSRSGLRMCFFIYHRIGVPT